MKTILTPPSLEVAEYHCDGCKQLVTTSGIPLEDPKNITNREFCLQMAGSFSNLAFDLVFCKECGLKIVELIEREFNFKITSTLFEDEENIS